MTNNEWLWKDTEAYRSDLYGRGERTMLLEIATALHEIAKQLAELNSYRRRTETELERFGG